MKTSFFLRTLAAFLFAALLITDAQGSSAPAARYGTLTGILRDADTQEPIPGTNVVLLDSRGNALPCTAKTRADGTFRLEKVPFGQYTFHATVLGYQPAQPKLIFSAKRAAVAMGTLSLQPLTQLLAYASVAK